MGRRTILITGSSGSLGFTLVAALKDHHAIVQLDARAPSDDRCGVGRVFTGRVTDPALVAEAMDGVDTVIHCAAIPSTRKPYHALIESNVMGTFHVLEAAGNSKKVEQFIYISSLTWHGLSESPFTNRPLFLPINEDHPSLAVDYYACSKVQAEYWCEKYVARFRKPVVAVRPPMIVTLKAQPEFRAGPAPGFPDMRPVRVRRPCRAFLIFFSNFPLSVLLSFPSTTNAAGKEMAFQGRANGPARFIRPMKAALQIQP